MEHSAVLLTCIRLPHGIKTFVLSIFKWLLKTGFTFKKQIYFQDKNIGGIRVMHIINLFSFFSVFTGCEILLYSKSLYPKSFLIITAAVILYTLHR